MDASFMSALMQDQIAWLAISGIGGAFFRAVFIPERSWRRRIQQAAAGAFAAIFGGGFLAHYLNIISDAGLWAYMACGFLLGSGGELGIKAVQDKVFGKTNGPSSDSK